MGHVGGLVAVTSEVAVLVLNDELLEGEGPAVEMLRHTLSVTVTMCIWYICAKAAYLSVQSPMAYRNSSIP